MHKPAPPLRWYAPWRGTTPRDDPADMGTAFGLDLSLAPSADIAGPHGQTGGVPRNGWVQRWVERRRATT